MSTPTVERTRVARDPAARRAGRDASSVPSPRDPGGAVGRAYARRAGRQQRLGGGDTERRSQFVLLIMAMLGVGLVASLWLSTTASADSYRLNAARQATRDLSERIEVVQSQIDAMQSPPAIARAAGSLGMVQVPDVARLIVAPDGKVSVFGTPKAAVAAPPPPPLVPSATAPGVTPGAVTPGGVTPGGVSPGAVTPGAGAAAAPAGPVAPGPAAQQSVPAAPGLQPVAPPTTDQQVAGQQDIGQQARSVQGQPQAAQPQSAQSQSAQSQPVPVSRSAPPVQQAPAQPAARAGTGR